MNDVNHRLSWDNYFLEIARAVSLRADCTRRMVGAVIWDSEHRIIGTGYNGVRAGLPGCRSGACPRGRLSYDQVAGYTNYDDPSSPGYCISVHAETNAIIHAGRAVVGCSMAVTAKPCGGCTKLLSGSGLARVIWPEPNDQIGEMVW